MVNAEFINAQSGNSERGFWAKFQVIAKTITGGETVVELWGTENALNASKALKPRQRCKLLLGVDERGHIKVADIRTEA